MNLSKIKIRSFPILSNFLKAYYDCFFYSMPFK